MHWHGLAIPNAMDGVSVLTEPAIAPGTNFFYRFAVPMPAPSTCIHMSALSWTAACTDR